MMEEELKMDEEYPQLFSPSISKETLWPAAADLRLEAPGSAHTVEGGQPSVSSHTLFQSFREKLVYCKHPS